MSQSILEFSAGNIGWNWTVLAILTLVSGSATVSLPSLPASVSVSETFVFTSVILFGSSAGTLTVALDAAIISFWSIRKGQPAYKILFNVCALPLTVWIAARLFFFVAEISTGRHSASLPLFKNPDPLTTAELLGPLFVFTVVYFGLNSWVITFAIALERRSSAWVIWLSNFPKLSLNYLAGASVAALFVSYTRELDYALLIIIIPLVIVLYFTFATSMGRVEDANTHLTALNTLYMSTIETLAMAIDAKDQVTHGHIRRVQTFAVTLAKAFGVKEVSMIRAIEAAALLHDMGKLAVPEHILNKPGPLTQAEFEKMKLHATVGAEILSSIDFPYPVVPIVRHHHESWDGSGYPDGLKGSAIPLGARILSVVDCFDALTSDRPYRPRLSDSSAIDILLQRRGTMYDPLVVDAFVSAHNALAFDTPRIDPPQVNAISAISRSAIASENVYAGATLRDMSSTGVSKLKLLHLLGCLEKSQALPTVVESICTHLANGLPRGVIVIYVLDDKTDGLVARFTYGDGAELLRHLRIARGDRLSGWVAANQTSIMNSDAMLDLSQVPGVAMLKLKTCLSAPLATTEGILGVLTAYSPIPNAYTDDDRLFLELAAGQISSVNWREHGLAHGFTASWDTTGNSGTREPQAGH